MKRFLIGVFVFATFLSTTFVGVKQAEAATSSVATLLSTETSKSTSRIDVTGSMYLSVWNYGSKDIKYTIFKNGIAYASGVVNARNTYTNSSLSLPTAQYSVRLYCGVYTSTTGCQAQVNIHDN